MNVLLIAVDAAAIDWMALAISIRGHTAFRAGDARSALQRLTEVTCELIIIGDRIGGDEERNRLCREIRMLPRARTATIWVLIASDQPLAVMSAIDAGATSYLSLPLDPHQMRERFEAIEIEPATIPTPPIQSGSDVQQLIELISDPVAIVDELGRFQHASPRIEHLLGFASDELHGINIEACTHPDDIQLLLSSIRAAIADPRSTAAVNIRLQRRDRTWQPVELHCLDMRHHPSVGGVLLLAREAAERQPHAQEIERPPIIDPVTGLAGSELFHEHLALALARGERANRASAVILFEVPDIADEPLDDVVRARIAGRLRGTIRSSDVVAQLGHNLWGILADEVDSADDANVIVVRLRVAYESLQNHLPNLPKTQPAVGVAISHPGMTTLGSIMRDAEMAIQQSKAGQPASAAPAVDDDNTGAGPQRSTVEGTSNAGGDPEQDARSARDDGVRQMSVTDQRMDVIDRFLALEANLAQFLNDQPK